MVTELLENPALQCDASCSGHASDCPSHCPEYRTYNESYNRGLAPIPHISVSDFADAEVRLPKKGNKEPGQWRTSRTPYLREIMNNLGPWERTQYTAVVKGTQLGFTTIVLILLAYVVSYCPQSILHLLPTLFLARRHSKGKLGPFIEENHELFKGKIRDPRDKTGGNELLSKEFPGGEIYIGGAQSAASLSSFTVKYVIRDERDRYPADVEGEGDPGELAENRADTFGDDAKFYDLSSPTIKDISPIWDSFEDSDQRYFNVPCPNCGIKQKLEWDNINYEHSNYRLTSEVTYRCGHCKILIPEHKKTYMLDHGEWIPENPGHEKRGYHLSSLYSPLGWLSWKKIVREYLFAMKNQDSALLKKFWNTRLALCWDDSDQPVLDEKALKSRIEFYGLTVPMAALVLTASVDVQSSPARLECEVKAHGPHDESWTLEYQVFDGDPGQEDVWEELAEFLWQKKRYHKSGAQIGISITLIDSGGHFTQQVYDFCLKYRKRKAFATKGSQFPGRPIYERAGRKKGSKKPKNVDFFIGTDTAKDTIFSRLNADKKDPRNEAELYAPITQYAVEQHPYRMHFNETCDDEYFAQLVAEKPEKVKVGRRYVRRYVQIRERNEALDLNVLNLAAVSILRPNWPLLVKDLAARVTQIRTIQKQANVSEAAARDIIQAFVPAAQPRASRRIISSGIAAHMR